MNPFGVRREKLGELIGSETIAAEMIAAGWLKPIVDTHKLCLFSVAAVAKAFHRMETDGRPPIIPRATPRKGKGSAKAGPSSSAEV